MCVKSLDEHQSIMKLSNADIIGQRKDNQLPHHKQMSSTVLDTMNLVVALSKELYLCTIKFQVSTYESIQRKPQWESIELNKRSLLLKWRRLPKKVN